MERARSICLIFVFFNIVNFCNGLFNCNETVSILQICKLDPFYAPGKPAWNENDPPLQAEQIITIFNIVEFDVVQSTLTLNLILSISWNDSRLSLISSKDDK